MTREEFLEMMDATTDEPLFEIAYQLNRLNENMEKKETTPQEMGKLMSEHLHDQNDI